MWLFNLLFSSLSQLWYVEVRISRSVSVSPFEFEKTRSSVCLRSDQNMTQITQSSQYSSLLFYRHNEVTMNSLRGWQMEPLGAMFLPTCAELSYKHQELDHKTQNFSQSCYWRSYHLSIGGTKNKHVGKGIVPLAYINLYHSLGIFSRRQIDDIFLIFPRKQDLTFHANCLLRRQFAWNVISCFLRKIRKIFQNVVCWKFYPEC